MQSQTDIPLHPLRHSVLEEVHARPFELVKAPMVILKYIFWKTEGIDARTVLAAWCQSRDLTEPSKEARRASWFDGNTQLIWEEHTEFMSLSWFGHPDELSETDPFSVFAGTPPVLGELINALRIDVRKFGATQNNEPDSISQLHFGDFDPNSLCVSTCSNKTALIATDFRQDKFGLSRFLIIDMDMRANNCGALVRRIGEIETYRAVAVLGLPEAQRAGPILSKLEQSLEKTFVELNTVKTTDENQRIMNRLYRIAMDLETLTIDSKYRFAASRAYFGIVEQRLEAVNEEPHMDYTTFKTFLLRRIMPAIQTCDAIERRQRSLEEKIMNASDLLRTQVDLDVQVQNQGLLKALNERSKQQYQLQQTVEGLSVVAITYYAVSLLAYIYKGVNLPFDLSPKTMVAFSVPVVIIIVWIAIRYIKNLHNKY